jgi:uncharacterized protein (DUF433 family)
MTTDDAAKESNLPSRGLPGPASFEERPEPGKSPGYAQFSALLSSWRRLELPSSGHGSGHAFCGWVPQATGSLAHRLDREYAHEAMEFTRITTKPDQMGGVPCIRGLRIPVATVVGMVADGMSEQEILGAYPDLEAEDIREALRYAAEAVRERELPLSAAG